MLAEAGRSGIVAVISCDVIYSFAPKGVFEISKR